MIPIETIYRIKQISIIDYLSYLGFFPIDSSGKEIVYYSPKREEKTASFHVNIERNIFKDFGDENGKGSIIDLVMWLNNYSFLQAVEILKNYTNSNEIRSFSFSCQNTPQTDSNIQILQVKPLTHKALISYAFNRGISFKTLHQYTKEIHYESMNKEGKTAKYFSIGFQNDLGGYELRNDIFKNSTAPKGITTIEGKNKTTLNLFEGFFDFLSALEFYQLSAPYNTTIILNTLSHLGGVLSNLNRFEKINCFFDNDKGGKNAVKRLINNDLQIDNKAISVYPNHKDFNDYLSFIRTKDV